MAANFILIGDELYKKVFVGSYLKCLSPSEADYALREVHSGICGEHLGGRVFTSFCKDLHIQLEHTAVAHPQTNEQTKVTNRTVLKRLKTRLEKAGEQWVEELHNVLWAYRTTARTPTKETPYNLCFGTETAISVDIRVPNPRLKTFNSYNNEKKL
ncbi:uncharacterized protein LOC110037413 [Phalaenopsis equestris]|uniref:uncharacterized protein LOC110037413 n=1 Tax=Phalaenopsis equestris TaxID=78828 RepID=UPI0009E531A3|nr:uncharacterized protein LOC110037413 [Phalaenopsis equestris]